MAGVSSDSPPAARAAEPFGTSEVRLNARQWAIAAILLLLVTLVVPWLWPKLERVPDGPDYRIPYRLSQDYWLYGQQLGRAVQAGRVIVLGDSVIWGEYVLPDGTLSHFLNRQAGRTNRFTNAGVNGFFPLALDGLLRYYGSSLHGRKVLLHCNLLWMTSPERDLSARKEQAFNHSRLVPQFFPRIACYKAGANERLSALVERQVSFLAWVGHLQNACFGQKSIPAWTLEDDGGSPPRYPNAYRNPLVQVTFNVPSDPKEDPQRGPGSPRHKPWSATAAGPTHFDWVEPGSSVQWRAFQRTVHLLRERGNDLLVVVGPFNEPMMDAENRLAFQRVRAGVEDWLSESHIPHVVPETLPSALYADASHPLTEGYERLARQLGTNEVFRQWSGQR